MGAGPEDEVSRMTGLIYWLLGVAGLPRPEAGGINPPPPTMGIDLPLASVML
jgi:hypothetical protein